MIKFAWNKNKKDCILLKLQSKAEELHFEYAYKTAYEDSNDFYRAKLNISDFKRSVQFNQQQRIVFPLTKYDRGMHHPCY